MKSAGAGGEMIGGDGDPGSKQGSIYSCGKSLFLVRCGFAIAIVEVSVGHSFANSDPLPSSSRLLALRDSTIPMKLPISRCLCSTRRDLSSDERKAGTDGENEGTPFCVYTRGAKAGQ